ncbi:MAG: ABC transporter substrate-binding protein, partial [Defluviitaleaceae bacterium]|nr:ABC transporter substrate-binding protein [Defluviitaleaceae bacterium]
MKRLLLTLAGIMIMMLVFTACNRGGDDTPDDTGNGGNVAVTTAPAPVNGGAEAGADLDHPFEVMDALLARYPQYFNTGQAHVPGTTFVWGIGSTAALQGRFGGALWTDQVNDTIVAGLLGTSSSLVAANEFRQYSQDGVSTFEVDRNNNTITMTLQHEVFWHDGVELTMEDLYFTFHVLAHPDYQGQRFTAEERMIEGIMAFNAGEADSISGLTLSADRRTLTIQMTEMPVTLQHFGLWSTPLPRHVFYNIPVSEMNASGPVLDANYIIGWGPFRIVHIVPGDSVLMERNPYYVWGAPLIEYLRVERFDPGQGGMLMEAGEFDFIQNFPTHLYAYHQNPANFQFLGSPSPLYNYVAFRLGNFDFDAWENIYNPNRLMSQLGPDFRRAMGYAVNPSEFAEIFNNGLRFAAGGMSPPNHPHLFNPDAPRFSYNPDRADEILDAAGFTNRDGSGYRTFPDGTPITLYWAIAEGPLAEETFIFYSQAWSRVGVRVELWEGRFHDQLDLWDMLDFDMYYDSPDHDTQIHIWSASWQVGFNPNPEGVWGHADWNASRYTSPAYEAILARMTSPNA